jgi:membrane protease YdiL (CAAX protease family)
MVLVSSLGLFVYVAINVVFGVSIGFFMPPSIYVALTRILTVGSQVVAFIGIPLGAILLMGYSVRRSLSIGPIDRRLVVLSLLSIPAVVGFTQALNHFIVSLIPDGGFIQDYLFNQEMMRFLERLISAQTWGEFLAVVFVVAVSPAICEEIFFRGALQTSLAYRINWLAAVSISSICFAIVHINPIQIIALMPLSIYFGLMAARSGCLLYASLVHFGNNLIAVSLPTFARTQSDGISSVKLIEPVAWCGLGAAAAFWLWVQMTRPPVTPGPLAGHGSESERSGVGQTRGPVGWRPKPPVKWGWLRVWMSGLMLLFGLIGSARLVQIQKLTFEFSLPARPEDAKDELNPAESSPTKQVEGERA